MKRLVKACRVALALFVAVSTLTCLSSDSFASEDKQGTVSISLVGKYDSADTCAIRAVNPEKKEITFRNHVTGRSYTLSYDNTSMIYSSRGTAISAMLLEQGQIVNVTFLKSSKHITSLQVSSEAWVIDSTRDHELVRGDGTARVKGDIYRLDTKTLVIAEDKLALPEDVLATDCVRVSGIGKDIYSVVVTSGHGYVSLSSDSVENHSLVGAWIELDNDVIYKISPNMLLSAPEGDYNLSIIGNGANYQSEVTISRNQETVVDTSNVTINKPKEGMVTFEVTPENAEVFVDGDKVITGVPQTVLYGYHNLKVMADGYITQTKYLKVGTPKSVVSIELEKDPDAATASSSDSGSSGSSTSDKSSERSSLRVNNVDAASVSSSHKKNEVTSNNSQTVPSGTVITGYKIYIDKPYGAELYFDGNYVGMIPTSVVKISGNHEIILKKEGYETKSYRICVDSDQDNVKYEFPDLIKITTDDSSSDSGSTKDSSDAASSASSDDGASTVSSDSGSEATTAAPEADTEATKEATTPPSDEGKTSSEQTDDKEPSGDGADLGDTTKPEEGGGSDAANTASGEG
ncbi:PEGA domain-containing protein [Butyrivibrio proteoclasticus]|uniref:PEGA domain-containing protein n=1 Tax=Butyrivibrio proteoclasticus TaxID=43305 RepID=UPI00047CDE61|nr:PEGA domain-containing protein [Butyrivibrio proteoclasticus]